MDDFTAGLWYCALGGTAFFVVRLVMSALFGLHHDVGGAGDVHHGDGGELSDFKLVSFYTVFAFLMMFGWSGLAARSQYALPIQLSFLIALATGSFTMVVVAYSLSLFGRFTSSGDTFMPRDIVGQTASVYQRIPADGTGVIHITYAGLLREVAARSSDGTAIESFTNVTVTALTDPSTVSVRKVQE